MQNEIMRSLVCWPRVARLQHVVHAHAVHRPPDLGHVVDLSSYPRARSRSLDQGKPARAGLWWRPLLQWKKWIGVGPGRRQARIEDVRRPGPHHLARSAIARIGRWRPEGVLPMPVAPGTMTKRPAPAGRRKWAEVGLEMPQTSSCRCPRVLKAIAAAARALVAQRRIGELKGDALRLPARRAGSTPRGRAPQPLLAVGRRAYPAFPASGTGARPSSRRARRPAPLPSSCRARPRRSASQRARSVLCATT